MQNEIMSIDNWICLFTNFSIIFSSFLLYSSIGSRWKNTCGKRFAFTWSHFTTGLSQQNAVEWRRIIEVFFGLWIGRCLWRWRARVIWWRLWVRCWSASRMQRYAFRPIQMYEVSYSKIRCCHVVWTFFMQCVLGRMVGKGTKKSRSFEPTFLRR